MAGREGYAINTRVIVNFDPDTLAYESQPEIASPCCPHYWVTCGPGQWANTGNRLGDMDYLGGAGDSPELTETIAMFNMGAAIGTPNCNTLGTPSDGIPGCCGINGLDNGASGGASTVNTNMPAYCYQRESLFKNAPATRDLNLNPVDVLTCEEFVASGGTLPVCPTLGQLVSLPSQGQQQNTSASAGSSALIGAVALSAIVVIAAALFVVKRGRLTSQDATEDDGADVQDKPAVPAVDAAVQQSAADLY
jgi:hypothetical protein